MKLNTKRITVELKKPHIDRSISWLAKQIGISQPLLYYRLKNKLVIDADKIASTLGLPLADVLIDETD